MRGVCRELGGLSKRNINLELTRPTIHLRSNSKVHF